LKRDEQWEAYVQFEDSGWHQNAHPVMKLYTETTDGSMIYIHGAVL
ncbi:hypothetical protein Tco_1543981, partial [Tanacetum coccineum]